MSVHVRADKKDRKLRSKQRGEWLFFLLFCVFLGRGEFFLFPVFFQHRHTDTERICVCMLNKTGNKKTLPGLRKTQNSIHPFVCFSASCPFCPRGHWLTVCISRCIKTYCTHRNSEVIAALRFSASKISRLPPKILVPATLVPLPQFRDVICVALLPCSCNAHAIHMQHTCNTTCNTSLFLGNFQEKCPREWKSTFSILRLGLSWKRQILHVDCKFTGKMLVLHVVLHVCCMCVAWAEPHKSHPWTGEVGQAWSGRVFFVSGLFQHTHTWPAFKVSFFVHFGPAAAAQKIFITTVSAQIYKLLLALPAADYCTTTYQ